MTALRIGLLGHVGNGNLGDEALIGSVIENIRRLRPDAEIIGFTIRPADTERRHGIPAFPLRKLEAGDSGPDMPQVRLEGPTAQPGRLRRWLRSVPLAYRILRSLYYGLRVAVSIPGEIVFLAASARRLRGIDCLLVCGSQQLIDVTQGGAWGAPYTLFKWSRLARHTGTKFVLLSVGAGPLHTGLSRWFIRRTLASAVYRSFRDPRSVAFVQSLSAPEPNHLVPDLVFSLSLPPVTPPPDRRALRIGVNPLPFAHGAYWYDDDATAYRQYVDRLAELVIQLGEHGHEVVLYATQLNSDPAVMADVAERVRALGGAVELAKIDSQQQLVAAIDTFDLTVATRYHGIVFSLVRHRPCVAIAYHGKSRDLMALVGLPEFAVDVDEMSSEALARGVLALADDRVAAAARIRERLPAIRTALLAQYRQVVPGPFSGQTDEPVARLLLG